MALIKNKKEIYPVTPTLKSILQRYNRYAPVPIEYDQLLRIENATPVYDAQGNDTLWQTVFYRQDEMQQIYMSLKKIYAQLKAYGDMKLMEHLQVERIDLCTYGNTKPFRLKVVNTINDNFDYFYIKNADSSRIYGLELEDILSPNKVSYLVYEQTLIEEHIAGIPGDEFIKHYLTEKTLNKVRILKEFIKFNERCLIRLLGDMHSSNFIIDITPDFEEVSYRIRAIDFDQQCYEGSRSIYMPQYFRQNEPILRLGYKEMTMETVRQYQQEERFLIAKRVKISINILHQFINHMKKRHLAPQENVEQLRAELADYYQSKSFLKAQSMGEILEKSLMLLFLRKQF